jgi:lipid A 3-O-deacylase
MNSCLPLKTCTALAALLFSLPSAAIDLSGAALEAGAAPEVGMVRAQLQSAWAGRWFVSRGTHVGGYWDAGLFQWRARAYRNVPGQHQYITGIGVTPMFRLQADDLRGWYAEAGVGVNLLSKLYNNNDDYLSTAFQFNDRIGAGYVTRQGWDIGLRCEHFSNGGIKDPNSGVNFVVLRVARQF